MPRISKDKVSKEKVSAQKNAVEALKEHLSIVMSTTATDKTEEKYLKRLWEAFEKVDATSVQLRVEMLKARVVMKSQAENENDLLKECNRAWEIARSLGHEPESAD